jgi:hypothetical protein
METSGDSLEASIYVCVQCVPKGGCFGTAVDGEDADCGEWMAMDGWMGVVVGVVVVVETSVKTSLWARLDAIDLSLTCPDLAFSFCPMTPNVNYYE